MAYLQNMLPSDLKSAVENNVPLFVSCGSIEYHGSQLPLGTDLLIIEGILRELDKLTDIVIAPSFTFSPTGFMVSGADKGTVDVRLGTFISQVADVLNCYKKMGFKHIYVLTHHQGGNIKRFVEIAVEQINSYGLYEYAGEAWWTEQKKAPNNCEIKVMHAYAGAEVSKDFFGHGGKGETQPILALYPELVHFEKFSDNEAFWNKDALESNKENSDKALKTVLNAWKKELNF